MASSVQLNSSTNQKTDENAPVSITPKHQGLRPILKAFSFLSFFLPASFCLCLLLASGKIGVGLIVILMSAMVHFYCKPDPEGVRKSFAEDVIRWTRCGVKAIKPAWRVFQLFDPLDFDNLEDNLEKFKDNQDFKLFKRMCIESRVSRRSSLILCAIKLLLLSFFVYGCSITVCVGLATATCFYFTSLKIQLEKFDADRRQGEISRGALKNTDLEVLNF